MPITTIGIGAAVTPTVIKTYVSHYANRKPRRQKPTAHISYDEGLHLIRSFLDYASHHTVEDLQAFTAQWVPSPSWVRTENVAIPEQYVTTAATSIVTQLGENGIKQVGGTKWWQWRRKNAELKGEWIEMRADYNARKQLKQKSTRIMLYIHGGAYFFGSVDEHRYQMQRHARKLKARVFAPRYRLSPQFPFPCGLQDCLAAYLYLLSLHDRTEIVLAGDSAGGGMVVSLLCLLRDQELPLPAGAILISPWVDLTHSFPSVAGGNEFDYIPAHGFMQKPSASWPPPNDDDMEAIRRGAGQGLVKHKLEKRSVQQEKSQGFTEHKVISNNDTIGTRDKEHTKTFGDTANKKSTIPGPSRHLSIEVEGKMVELRDQIQMYATNQLISHPLVSPVLQPSLGGLPPLLILTGGGEVLRDEQIYLAHKAANPAKYPLGSEYRARYDPGDKILHKYKPTPVQLQVWEDLCHVAPTLSFTRPAKYMYRSIAQFGAWALARAQNTSIEMTEDDDISVISSSESDTDDSSGIVDKEKAALASSEKMAGVVGRAGDPIPPFKNHMIRQRVDRHGDIYALEPASALPALQMQPSEIGVIKIGPVKKWMDAKQYWDTKYARSKRRIQQKRIRTLAKHGQVTFGEDEIPPPSALAGRQHEESEMITKKLKKSFGLAMWSGWGSKHDEDTIRREEGVTRGDLNESAIEDGDHEAESVVAKRTKSHSMSRARTASRSKKVLENDRSRSRRRTISVRDIGQAENQEQTHELPDMQQPTGNAQTDPRPITATSQASGGATLTPMFLPKFKNQPHLQEDSRDMSDNSSVRTGTSAFDGTIPDNASTNAVFGAAGVSRNEPRRTVTSPRTNGASISDRPDSAGGISTVTPDTASMAHHRRRTGSATDGYETPGSQRSIERLKSHQVEVTSPEGDIISLDGSSIADASGHGQEINGEEVTPRLQPLRNASSMAIAKAEGVVGIVDGGVADSRRTNNNSDNDETMSRLAPLRNASSMAVSHAEGVVGVVAGGVADKGRGINGGYDGNGLTTIASNRLTPIHSASSTAVFKAEGVVGVVKGGVADHQEHRVTDTSSTTTTPSASNPVEVPYHDLTTVDPIATATTTTTTTNAERPVLYDRTKTEFKTALERL